MSAKSLRWTRRAIAAAVAGFFLVAGGELRAGEAAATPTPAIPEVIRLNCAQCHGENLEGGSGGALLPLRAELAKDEKALRKWIVDGDLDKGMPPSENLSPEEVNAVMDYLRKAGGTGS
jgi:mono/diheme cytochrome c family protein